MQFSAETSANGVIEREFSVGDVPGVLWSPTSGSAPLILMGHPGGLHKKTPALVARAHHFVSNGFAVASIDSPGHGDRPRSEQDEAWVASMLAARAAGQSIVPIVTEYNMSLSERAVPEWQATIDALEKLPDVGPIGYCGMTLATAIGIPLTAVDSRITAAVFGGVLVYDALFEAARQVTVPLQFILPLHDDELPRDPGLALFEAFASPAKTLHATPGNHFKVPWSETEDSTHFFIRHLNL
ncbi:alpha/beta hydrolase [Kribbella sp. NPDC051952]|uniref:alpha/beta hydrolase family protein n=1 Tax=Kribbella sp. NPDC051952 TaxID=3154851 RepID=UPI00342CAA4B